MATVHRVLDWIVLHGDGRHSTVGKDLSELAPLRVERVFGLLMVGLVAMGYKWEIRGGLISIAVLSFVAMMFVTSQFAVIPELCEPDLNAIMSTTISFFVIVFIVRTTYQLYFLLFAYIGIVFVYISKAQWEYFFNGAAQFAMGVKRLGGIEYYYGHPNAVGGSVVCSLPIAYFLYVIREDFCRSWPKFYRRLFPWFLRLYGVIAISAVLLTRSRSAAICVVAAVLMVAISNSTGMYRKVRNLAIVGVVVLIGFFILPSDMQGRIQTIWDSSVEKNGAHRGATESAEGRVVGVMLGMEMFQRYPWTGVGLANYKQYREARLDGTFLDAHNLVAEVMAETGVLGTASFVALLAIVVFSLLKVRKRAKYAWHSDAFGLSVLSISCLQVLGMLLLQGVTSHNLHRYNWFWLAAFAAICVRQSRLLSSHDVEPYYEEYDDDDYEFEEEYETVAVH